ncbi:MAG: type II secretion system F family protein [Verrucomicrobiales bacterium]|nr:type II secretion system F family protein [Verrucomicrobiales bacterium]
MNRDELAFFNEQLAAMLRLGIPLESALRQLTAGMRRGDFREEIEQLEADLAHGRPLREAVAARRLPALYQQMLIAGAQGGDLPGLLTLAADHYRETHNLRTRLLGLVVYPTIALVTSMVVSILLAVLLAGVTREVEFAEANTSSYLLWIPPALFGVVLMSGFVAGSVPVWRRALRWSLPGFRDASLARLAGTLSLLLKSGCRLPDALKLCAELEQVGTVSRELLEWEKRLARGEAAFAVPPARHRPFPPLFLWSIASDREDWLSGVSRAADLYRRRAAAKAEMFLYAALPVMVLMLGALILAQATFAIRVVYLTIAMQIGDFGL